MFRMYFSPFFFIRTLLDACEEMEEELASEQLSTVAIALEEELKVYRAQRYMIYSALSL